MSSTTPKVYPNIFVYLTLKRDVLEDKGNSSVKYNRDREKRNEHYSVVERKTNMSQTLKERSRRRER